MAAEISSVKRRKPHGFMTLLSSAACEWFLIFLIFLDAALSYLLVKFAHYCDLKEPCPLCSRLDHTFRRNKPRSFYTLLCNNHKEEVSSSVPCSIHGNFADINSLCEECLMPIATQKKPNSESYRLLAGKLWVDVEQSVFQHLVMNKYIHLGSSIRKTCLCCNKTWRTKSNEERLLEFTPVALGASKANVKPPLPRVPGRSRFSRRDSLKRLREKFTGPMKPMKPITSESNKLSHVGYTKLKIASDSESEFPFSEDDDDDANTVCSFRSVKSYSNGERDLQFGNRGTNGNSEKQTSQGLEPKCVTVDQPNLLDLSEHKSDSSSKSDAFVEHGLRELNWAECYNKPAQSLTTELISLEDGPQPSNGGGSSISPLGEESQSSVSLPHMSALSVLSELLSLGPSLSNAMTVPEKTNNVEGTSEKGNASTIKHIEAAYAEDTYSSKQDNMNSADCNENLKLSENHKIEHINVTDSAKTEEEEVKSLPQVSITEVSLPSTDDHSNSMAHENHEESRKDEDSSSHAIPAPESIPRNSSHESLDGINVGDIEGESIVDRLKRQMDSLYKELEEERNAAAIAANEAMAMITRLHEEKAALHMEALQYLRMMEEQAEYDMEALQKANDMLAEKEKELQDLETELEFYRNNLLDESGVPDLPKEYSNAKTNAAVHTENTPGAFSNSKSNEISIANGNCATMNSTAPKFEDEKSYILQHLRNLEEKLHQSYCNRKLDELNCENNKDQENGEQIHKVISSSNGKIGLNGSTAHDEENGCLYERSDELSRSRGETSSAILKEIADLHDRLRLGDNPALEVPHLAK